MNRFIWIVLLGLSSVAGAQDPAKPTAATAQLQADLKTRGCEAEANGDIYCHPSPFSSGLVKSICRVIGTGMSCDPNFGTGPAEDACSMHCDALKDVQCTPGSTCPDVYQSCMQECKQMSGVDPGLVGTWELRMSTRDGVSRWVWEIHQDGAYRFLTEGPPAGVPPHRGSLVASYGLYLLDSKPAMWADQGTYLLQDSATLITHGELVSGTWHRIQSKAIGHGESRAP